MRELYVIEFESANYAGAHETCMVWATSEDDAQTQFELSGWGEDYYREQDYDQYVDENGSDEDVACWSTFNRAVRVAGSRYEQFVNDPSQASFYQIVNEE